MAVRKLQGWNQPRALVFIMVCMVLIRGATAEVKQDLPLDGSLEFYGVLIVSTIAAVALWELVKSCYRKVRTWIGRCQRARRKQERLQQKTKEAVRKEIQRQGLAASPVSEARGSRDPYPGLVRRQYTREGISTQESPFRGGSIPRWPAPSTRTTSTQTEEVYQGPQWIDARRIQGFEGPFYATPNGDCIHTIAGCHGQRNATGPSKTYRLCRYCDRDRPLVVVNPSLG